MAFCFKFPQTDGYMPLSFIAWGRYDHNDVDFNQPQYVTMTPQGGAGVQFPFDPPRGDDVWTAHITGLTNATIYTAAANYTSKAAAPVIASQETDIQATNMPMAVPAPPIYIPLPLPLPLNAAAKGVGGVLGPGGVAACCPTEAILSFGQYPDQTCPKIHKAVAIVRKRRGGLGGPILSVPRAYTSVHSVSLLAGQWTVLIPAPADIATAVYVADVLFLDRYGRQVILPTTVGLGP